MTLCSITATFLLSVMDGTMRQQKPTLREQTAQLWSELRQTAVCLTTISYQTTGILYSTETDILLCYIQSIMKTLFCGEKTLSRTEWQIWNFQCWRNDGGIMTFIFCTRVMCCRETNINPLKPELNPICYLLALLAHHFLHVSRIRVKSLTIRLLMSYIYIYGAPILDVSRSHTTTQHSR